ncbi:unnamed protein product [Rhizoctonia solani]|uniref:CHAT domain-containing protein n=1 Tax=Rhizoctonia solani TaxID=456999 RepID=A0A8H3CMB9_9AGAM|nr:unnamed protein product [Rhizoctonia solani]
MMSEESKLGTGLCDLPSDALYRNMLNQAPEQDMKAEDKSEERGLGTSELDPQDWCEQARSHYNAFQQSGILNDIEKAIECGIRALDLTTDGDPDLPLRLAYLGDAYTDRFQRLGDLCDLAESIEYKARALTLLPGGHPDLARQHANLGVSYGTRFQHLGQLNDHEKSMEHYSRALEMTPDGHPDLSDRHAGLGATYTDRFRRLGELGDLEESIKHRLRALELTPDGHPHLSFRHTALGMAYSDRFQRIGQLDDLDKSMKHNSRALELTPDGHPHLSRRHANLGMDYGDRFRRLGELDDLEKSTEHRLRALELTPDGHPHLPFLHANLGAAYSDRFQRLGELGALEKSIKHLFRALELTPDGHPDLSMRHANLGVGYTHRFWRLGELDDLEKSIKHDSRALELTPDGHPHLSFRHANLGVVYSDRFRRLGELNDLEKSIEHRLRALELTPDDHPQLSTRHADLGVDYNDRFQRLGELDDLDRSIKHASRALELTPDDHPDLSNRHADLGVAYNDRFQHLRDLADLEIAIKHSSYALTLTPDGHPNLSQRHFDHAIYYFNQYELTHNPLHLQESLQSFRRASQVLTSSPRDKFQYALRWAALASKNASLQCIEAYQAAINLLPQFIWLGATTSQRYQDLTTAENLAVNAASGAILNSNTRLALEWVEQARCVVWNQSLMLRSPLDQLHSSHPDLAARLEAVAKQLYDAGSESSASRMSTSNSVDLEQVAQQRRQLAMEYNDLLAQTRELPGFDDFLQPMKANALVPAARHGPIVVISCHEHRSDALLILPGQDKINHLPLCEFTGEKALSIRLEMAKSVRSSQPRERCVERRPFFDQPVGFENVLAVLWHDIVKPVLEFLGYLNVGSAGDLPHITWCPTGALSFLPLHAAGDYDQPGSRVFDYVVSSYTPTITALLNSAPSSLGHDSRVLAISQANTPGHAPLPGTTRELTYVEAHMKNKVGYSQLVDDQATSTVVLDAMEHHDWVHLACHAHQNISDPTRSGFFLHDGTLDLAAINRRSFKNKGLAFLSACQTAKGDEELPDEAIHLASGMLMAGYPSVIATMWSIMDDDAPFVADKVYAELMKDRRVGSGEAGKALHQAVTALRNKVGEKEFGRWVPYIHIGS